MEKYKAEWNWMIFIEFLIYHAVTIIKFKILDFLFSLRSFDEFNLWFLSWHDINEKYEILWSFTSFLCINTLMGRISTWRIKLFCFRRKCYIINRGVIFMVCISNSLCCNCSKICNIK